jgi:hypothetical protein
MKGKELRDRFMKDNVDFLLKEFSAVLKGEQEDFKTKSQFCLNKSFEIVFDAIKSATNIDEDKAKSTSGIIKMLAAGDITPSEAKELLGLLDSMHQAELTEAKVGLNKAMIVQMQDKLKDDEEKEEEKKEA